MKCKTDWCGRERTGRSQYCNACKRMAREKWREKVAADKEARELRYWEFERLMRNAEGAGFKAGRDAIPEAMIVAQHTNQLDDTSPVAQQWIVPEGPCGFAWVNVSPGNSSFARWLVKNGHAHKAHRGGVDIWIDAQGQSYERKRAHAGAMADEITRAEIKGVTVYASGRLD